MIIWPIASIEKFGRLKMGKRFPNRKTGESETGFDAIDRRILTALQRDSLIGNQSLADAIGLSPPACLKRVRRLREVGVIERTVSLLLPEALGCPLLTIVRVKLERPTEANMAAFEAHVAAAPAVTQCLTVSGDIDYVLLVRARDVADYQDFARRMLATAPGIRAYTSEIVLAVNKFTTEIPIGDSDRDLDGA
jgi:Lrp/AsnC family transcriptional regulator, leucine-responsive regulatory protein